MKKAANILFLIGMILSILTAIGYLISGIICLAANNAPELKEQLIQVLENNHIPQAQMIANLIQRSLIGSAISAFISCGFAIANAPISWNGRTKGNTTIYVLNIVFGILSGVIINVVGAILALIADGNTKKREEVDAQAKEE